MPELRTTPRRIFLRILRWQIVIRSHPYATTLTCAVLLFTVAIVARWRYFYRLIPAWSAGFGNYVLRFGQSHPHLARILHVILDTVPDAVPLLLGLAGLVYLMPNLARRIEGSRPLRVGLATLIILFMFLAVVVNAINREAQEHRSSEDGAKITTVEATNEQILGAVLNPFPGSSESVRRERIEEVLRNRYILTHADISPEVLAGTAWPPIDWMDQQLAALHETWRFTEEPTKAPVVVQQMAPQPKMAEIGVSFYNDNLVISPSHDLEAVLDPSDQQTFKVDVAAYGLGDVTAKNVKLWFRICPTCVWVSEPTGSTSVPEHPTDREFQVGEILPGVATPKITLSIKRPLTSGKVEIAFYYACDNCPVLDTTKPMPLWVTYSGIPMPPDLSVPYTPTLGPQ